MYNTIKMLQFRNTFQNRQQQKASSFWGASPPDPLTRGSAPGPRWGTAPRPPTSSHQCYLFPPNLGCLDKTLPIDVVMFKFREMLPTGNRRNRSLFTWQKHKIPAASQTIATNNALTVLQISFKSVHFRLSY